jgi:hypothetical protein
VKVPTNKIFWSLMNGRNSSCWHNSESVNSALFVLGWCGLGLLNVHNCLIVLLKFQFALQVEVTQLRMELADKETQLSARTTDKGKSVDDELSWLDVLSHDINENVEERINLQKALFELEDMNLHNRAELQQLDELIADPVGYCKHFIMAPDFVTFVLLHSFSLQMYSGDIHRKFIQPCGL